jgi:hypothetical protein
MRTLPLLAFLLLYSSGAAFAAEAIPATAYFPLLPIDAPSDATPQLIALAANHPLDITHPGIIRAIIVIHDETRDANAALATIAALAGELNASTMILAPQFLLPSDIVRFADHLPDKGRSFAAWQVSGWAIGDDSMPVPGRKNISSFTAIDLLLMYLADRQAFPDLQEVTIAGFGAGADFTQRYAAFNLAAAVLDKQNIGMRYVVAGATSYLYQTPSRPLGGRKGFGHPDTCPDYNAYPYGLDRLVPYARHSGVNIAKTDYALHFITYLNAHAPDLLPESNCAALAQGSDSNNRATNYRLYLQSLYGNLAARTQQFAEAKEPKNDAVTLFGSSCGMAVLFGDGLCPSSQGATP